MGMWANEQFLTKRVELSVEIPKEIVHVFLMDPNWKNSFWKNAFDEMVLTATGCPVPKQKKGTGPNGTCY